MEFQVHPILFRLHLTTIATSPYGGLEPPTCYGVTISATCRVCKRHYPLFTCRQYMSCGLEPPRGYVGTARCSSNFIWQFAFQQLLVHLARFKETMKMVSRGSCPTCPHLISIRHQLLPELFTAAGKSRDRCLIGMCLRLCACLPFHHLCFNRLGFEPRRSCSTTTSHRRSFSVCPSIWLLSAGEVD